MNREHPRVLIVEDEPTIAHMLAKIFQTWHWEPVKVETVTAAIASLSLSRTVYDLVILDLMLPDGDGVDVLRFVRDRKLACPIAVATAKTFAGLDAVLALAPDQLLFKPFVFEPLKAMATEIYDAFEPRLPIPTPLPTAKARPKV